jgi:sulfite reductase (ferredoxin)
MATEIQKSPPSMEAATAKRSAVEGFKQESRQLRGTICDELTADIDHFSEANKQLLKFHGTYQQEDRDARKARRKDGVGKHYMFMVRCKVPAGLVTAEQYLAVDDLAQRYANGTLRLTTRQGIQLHGVLKSDLQDTIAGINQCLLSTLGACGDVERNVMACPAPHFHHGVHAQLQETAAVLAAHLAPRTRAYNEIWLNGQRVDEGNPSSPPELEPLYGKVYLPRKFKTGLALPEDNCIDVYAQDLGLLAIVENGDIVGYNVLVGGGMGMTHGNANTFPHLARPICYVPARAVVSAAEAVVKLFRDHGNRADRKRARIKYLVHDWGVDKFRDVLAEYLGGALLPPRPVEVRGFDPHHGWHSQGNGKCYYGLSIENGRIKDEGDMRLRTGLRALVERFRPSIRLTPLQDILLSDLNASARTDIDRTLAEFGIARPEQISNVQRYSMACPAIPTCGLALTESERVLPAIIDQLELALKRLGLEDEKLSVRMTGCPNGCARTYQSDIGLVGRSGDKYTVFVGGHVLGTRLNFMLKDLVPYAEIMPTLLPLLEHFKNERRHEESFGDYCHRLGVEHLRQYLPPSETESRGRGFQTEFRNQSKNTVDAGNGAMQSAEATNGAGHSAGAERTNGHANGGLPGTRLVPLLQVQPFPAEMKPGLSQPATAEVVAPPPPAATSAPCTVKLSETILAGPAGGERPDYTYRYHRDGSVRETVVYFYGDDQRCPGARIDDPLRREAVYRGGVDAYRLHAACKLTDTYHVGEAGAERRDRRVDYDVEGRPGQTVVFFYDGDVRASEAPPGASLRRQVAYEGWSAG